MFTGSSYQYTAAGLPDEIVKVDAEEVDDYYNAYYTLDNLTLYFYCNCEIEEIVSWLCREYLKLLESLCQGRLSEN